MPGLPTPPERLIGLRLRHAQRGSDLPHGLSALAAVRGGDQRAEEVEDHSGGPHRGRLRGCGWQLFRLYSWEIASARWSVRVSVLAQSLAFRQDEIGGVKGSGLDGDAAVLDSCAEVFQDVLLVGVE